MRSLDLRPPGARRLSQPRLRPRRARARRRQPPVSERQVRALDPPAVEEGIVFHSLRHTTATLLARAKVHPSLAQNVLRHAEIETTLATDLNIFITKRLVPG